MSDGWYWIRCTLDEPLKRAVEFSKLKIGDKIITSGAQIVNCEDGKDILALPENVRLVLHGNSTRRTLWDMKLGLFVKHVSPLPVSLNSVKAGGGLIGQLTLYVVHQHPMLYFQNTESSKGLFYKF